jgi:phage shock protein E
MNEIPYVQLIAAALAAALFLALRLRRRKNAARILAAIQAGARIIDVRSPAEYAAGHYPGAINIPHDKLGGKLKAVGSTDSPVIVYCASGGRSAAAERTLAAAGYQQVINAGGLSAMPAP